MTGLAEVIEQSEHVSTGRGGKYLTFTMADEEYGISILKIKEIIGMLPVTTVSDTWICKRRHQPSRKSYSGNRSAAEIRNRGDAIY